MNQPISEHTYRFARAMLKVRQAEIEFAVLIKDTNANNEAKKGMKDWVRMLKRIQQDFRLMIPNRAALKVFEEQLLNDEDTGQVNAIVDYTLALPKGIRNEIEQYVESRYDVYVLNSKN